MAQTKAKVKIQPLGDRVLIQALKETMTKGGIIIPDTVTEKPQQGTVIAVGPGRTTEKGERIAPEVKAGDKILFGKYSGTEIEVDGQNLLFLREGDILAVL